jgi:hypothetical protein
MSYVCRMPDRLIQIGACRLRAFKHLPSCPDRATVFCRNQAVRHYGGSDTISHEPESGLD